MISGPSYDFQPILKLGEPVKEKNVFYSTPNGTNGTPVFRNLSLKDIPDCQVAKSGPVVQAKPKIAYENILEQLSKITWISKRFIFPRYIDWTKEQIEENEKLWAEENKHKK